MSLPDSRGAVDPRRGDDLCADTAEIPGSFCFSRKKERPPLSGAGLSEDVFQPRRGKIAREGGLARHEYEVSRARAPGNWIIYAASFRAGRGEPVRSASPIR